MTAAHFVGDLERVHFASDRYQTKQFAALATITDALKRANRPYIAFSGGKDSLATTALVHLIRPDVPLVWSDDELEYPETVAFMTDLRAVAGDQLRILLGWTQHAHWFTPWTAEPAWREPFEGAIRVDGEVDDWMAEEGYDLVFTGVRMEENQRRQSWLLQVGPTYHVRTGTGRRCCPLWDWTADDVWALIAGQRLPYNAVYDRLESIYVPRKAQRVGPLPLARREHLVEGWPDLLDQLEGRYGRRWS